jgi:mannose-6-phosphate isomerase-like protein (cupin superfamily)
MKDDIRRVVTGHDETGKAIVLFDGANPHKVVRPQIGLTSRVIWTNDQTPADMTGAQDRGGAKVGIAPPAGGSVFRIVDFPPASADQEKLDPKFMEQMVHGAGHGHGPSKFRAPSHPFMHRTNSLDYAIVMSGEIDMLLDDGEVVRLKSGDVIVQQGTNHAWINRGKEPCRIAFILIDAKEP